MADKNKFYTLPLAYYILRILVFPLYLMPYRMIHALGNFFGTIAYYLTPKTRKIAFNNLSLVKDLYLSEKEMKRIAKGSYKNFIINTLEYFRLPRSKNKTQEFIQGYNLEYGLKFLNENKGLIGITGHFGNWELCFIHFTLFLQRGICIGRSIPNKKLYDFIKSVREMHGGKVIEREQALSYGLGALKKGELFTSVIDQVHIESSYSYPFLGARAWTTNAPALMAYKTNSPIVVYKIKRVPGGRYELIASDPIWPDKTKPWRTEVKRLMDLVMSDFEQHIKKYPDQWLWQYKKWRQGGFKRVYDKFRADSILFILPEDPKKFDLINEGTPILSKIYRRSFLTFLTPKGREKDLLNKKHEIITYDTFSDLFIRDYRFQLVFDFYENKKIKKHFLKLGAANYYHFEDLINDRLKLYPCQKTPPIVASEIFRKSLMKPKNKPKQSNFAQELNV